MAASRIYTMYLQISKELSDEKAWLNIRLSTITTTLRTLRLAVSHLQYRAAIHMATLNKHRIAED